MKDCCIRQNNGRVHPIDRLPLQLRAGKFYIANLDPSNKPGSHWVAVHRNQRGECELFDSYGEQAPLAPELERLFTRTKLTRNKQRLQHESSKVCGYYCLFYIYWRCRGRGIRRIERMFRDGEYRYNDSKVVNFVKDRMCLSKFGIEKNRQTCRSIDDFCF